MSRDFVSTRELLNRMGKGAMDAEKKALAEGAEAVKTEAKSRCPVYRGHDKRVVPGALRDSIHCVKRGGGGIRRGASWRMPKHRTAQLTASSSSSVRRSTSRFSIPRSMPSGTPSRRTSSKPSRRHCGGKENEHSEQGLPGIGGIEAALSPPAQRPQGMRHLPWTKPRCRELSHPRVFRHLRRSRTVGGRHGDGAARDGSSAHPHEGRRVRENRGCREKGHGQSRLSPLPVDGADGKACLCKNHGFQNRNRS